MAKKEGTLIRTVPFFGGRQDDVDEFMQDSPTMAEVTNVRFRSAGEVEKSLPMETLTNNESTAPVTLGVSGDNLFTVNTDGDVLVYKEGVADWSTLSSGLVPNHNEPLQGLAPANGGANYTFGETADYRLIAYERRRPNAGGSASTQPYSDLTIELYDIDNNVLLDRKTATNYFNPQVIDPGGGLVCYACSSSGTISRWSADAGVITANGTLGITTCETDFPTWESSTALDRDLMRIGHCEGGSNGALFVVGGDAGTQGAIFWKDSSGNTLKVQRLVASGALYGSSLTVEGSDQGSMPLDCSVSGNDLALIYGSHVETTGTWNCWVKAVTGNVSSTPTLNAKHTVHNAAGTVINGTIYMEGVTDVAYYAFTTVGRDAEDKVPEAGSKDSRIETGSCDASTFNFFAETYHHRVASKCTKLPDESAISVVIEQWTAMEPKNSTLGLSFLPKHLKGVTPVLVDFYDGNSYKVRSAFDVGQSRNCTIAGAEQTIHLPNLYRDSAITYRFINSVVLQPEDIANQPTGTDPTYSRNTAVLHPGETRGIIYEVAPASAATPLIAEVVGENAILNNAIPLSFDGLALGELSPLDQPEVIGFRLSNGTNTTRYGYDVQGGNADDYRTIQAVVGYQDANGQLHRSAPSFPLFVEGNVTAAGDGTDIWRDVIVTLPLSCFGGARDYFVEIYIGQGSLEPQLAGVQVSDVSSGSWIASAFTVIDSLTSGGGTGTDPVRFSEAIYTSGNVLASDPWPNFRDFVVTSNRLFAIGDTNKGTVYYSKLFEENIAPEFSASLTIPLGRSRTLQAIGAIDDKVIIFTEDEVFAIYDTGPDNTGANGSFIIDQLQTAFGCKNPNSLAQIADGLCFYSSRSQEFHIITRDLQVVDIGKPVQDATANIATLSVDAIKAAVVVPDEHEIRWFASFSAGSQFGPTADTGTGIPDRPARPRYERSTPADGQALVYNYHYKKWSVQEPTGARLSLWAVHNGRPNALSATFSHYRETLIDWTWSSEMMVETPWIRTASLQAYGRIEELLILGKYYSSWNDTYWAARGYTGILEGGDLQVDLWYDYEASTTPADTYRFRANRGDFGSENQPDRMQFAVHPGQPKCQAIKVRITEIPTEGVEVSEPLYGAGRGVALSAMDIVYTPKTGTGSKTLPAGRRK